MGMVNSGHGLFREPASGGLQTADGTCALQKWGAAMGDGCCQ